MKFLSSKHDHYRNRGFTIVECVIAIAIFSVISVVAFQIYLGANALQERASQKSKAMWLAEEGIEAVRSIRDESFTNLVNGTKGLILSGGKWQFSSSTNVIDG